MIAIDTNVLLRYLVEDDEEQAKLARRILEEDMTPERPGLVTLVAVLELDWVMRAQYDFKAKTVAEVISGLMASPNLVFERANVVQAALAFVHGDLADNILHLTGSAEGCSHTVTFDRKFSRLPGVELLA